MSSSITALPSVVQTEVLNVVWSAFYYRDDLKSFLLAAGVPPALYNRYDSTDNAKVKITRYILNELQQLGADGWAVQRKIAVDMCAMHRPMNGVDDVKAGQAAISLLRKVAADEHVIVDTKQAAIDERKARAERQQRQISERRKELDDLSERFSQLAQDRTRTPAEVQARGYQLETLLVDLFKAHDLDYVGSRRTEHEQVDGSFFFRGFTYLVEARWRKDPPTVGDLADFKFKVDRKMESTRGLFISMAGYADSLAHFNTTSGSRNNIIYLSGQDIALIFEGRVGLVDALIQKVDDAESRGEYENGLVP